MTEEGFFKGDSDNLPMVDMFMVADIIKNSENFPLGEIRGVTADKKPVFEALPNPDGIKSNLGLFQLMDSYVFCTNLKEKNCAEFVEYCPSTMDSELCSEAVAEAVVQLVSSLWFEVRYTRITASKLYKGAHCKKSDRVFVSQVLGVSIFKHAAAMTRVIKLEKKVKEVMEKEI
ncbi:unnamed protein product [Ceutorhynchus assimilis]|uniref:Uncharacterized protein n=1 Tax=Ceutorhynchus assimilis TaxID=467358 RepID=A0A9N9MZT2_9CUCU|nr:unnamed protein product [Ceutorhynchus assimilis]